MPASPEWDLNMLRTAVLGLQRLTEGLPSLQVVRAACILSHPVPNTNNAPSAQIILPQKQVCFDSKVDT